MQWLAAFCASFCFHQDHWELCHRLCWEQLWAVHVYLSCQHSHLAGPEDKLVLEVMVQCSESQRREMWIFWCEVFSHFLDYLEPQCHVVVTAELLYPSQLFWPKALAQMHLYQSSCAHPVLEKTSINLSSSFTFFLLIKAASTASSAQLSWFNCVGMKPLRPAQLCELDQRPQHIPGGHSVQAELYGCFDTSFVLL